MPAASVHKCEPIALLGHNLAFECLLAVRSFAEHVESVHCTCGKADILLIVWLPNEERATRAAEVAAGLGACLEGLERRWWIASCPLEGLEAWEDFVPEVEDSACVLAALGALTATALRSMSYVKGRILEETVGAAYRVLEIMVFWKVDAVAAGAAQTASFDKLGSLKIHNDGH
jgi:hypothetical protein